MIDKPIPIARRLEFRGEYLAKHSADKIRRVRPARQKIRPLVFPLPQRARAALRAPTALGDRSDSLVPRAGPGTHHDAVILIG